MKQHEYECERALHNLLTNTQIHNDLMQSVTQVTRTTKQDRRERCLAYLLDAHTGSLELRLAHSSAREFYELANRLHTHSPLAEVKVACERTMRRMSIILNEPEWTSIECPACGVHITLSDHNHHCDLAKINRRNAALSHDSTVELIS